MDSKCSWTLRHVTAPSDRPAGKISFNVHELWRLMFRRFLLLNLCFQIAIYNTPCQPASHHSHSQRLAVQQQCWCKVCVELHKAVDLLALGLGGLSREACHAAGTRLATQSAKWCKRSSVRAHKDCERSCCSCARVLHFELCLSRRSCLCTVCECTLNHFLCALDPRPMGSCRWCI
jgi:hypothetical protein